VAKRGNGWLNGENKIKNTLQYETINAGLNLIWNLLKLLQKNYPERVLLLGYMVKGLMMFNSQYVQFFVHIHG
jgi:hypothetical protein